MSERPEWTNALQNYLMDDVTEHPSYAEDGSADVTLDLIEEAVNAILCNTYGHEIIDDQCMIPSHRYCVYCAKLATTLGIER